MKVGIDIGTSYSSICIINKEGKAEPIKIDTGLSFFGNDYSLPSAVFLQNNKFLVGQAAYTQRAKNPQKFKSDFKRDFGQGIPYSIGDKQVTPEDLYKELFIHLKNCAEEATGESVSFACITHPASFTDKQRELLTKSAHESGLLKIELLSEPVAAGYNYLSEEELKESEKILVYDFGGGTFDAALLEYNNKKFELIGSPVGLEQCGGIDFDQQVYKEIKKTVPKEIIDKIKTSPLVYKKYIAHLPELSVQAKHHLSSSDVFEIDIATGMDSIEFRLEKSKFNNLISHFVDDSIANVNSLLNKANLKYSDVDKVVLVGGSCRVPLVKEKISTLFKGKVFYPSNPELSIAKGAALVAANYEEKEEEFYLYCPSCKTIRLAKEYRCSKCGQEAEIPEFISENMKREYLKSLTEFVKHVNKDTIYGTDNLINATVANYVETVQYAKGVANSKELRDTFTEHFIGGLDTFLQQCVSNEFHVALIGAIKSGKSTLINALLEQDLASTSVTPETAALTKFRSAKEKDFVRVSFYSKEEWDELWQSVDDSGKKSKVFKEEYNFLESDKIKNKYIGHCSIVEEFADTHSLKQYIKKWSSSKSAEHYFVKELEIGLKDFKVPEEVVFVDTPGLNDPVPYRSNITRNYIGRANLVLVCIKADSLSQPELNTIHRVFVNARYNPSKVYVIGTQVDSITSPLKNWPKQRAEWLKYLKNEGCYGDRSLAEKNLLHVAAWLYTCMLKRKKNPESLSDEEEEVLETGVIKYKVPDISKQSDYNKLIDFTNLNQVRAELMGSPIDKAKKIMLQDITEKYKSIKTELVFNYEGKHAQYTDYVKALTEGVQSIHSKIELQKREISAVNEIRESMSKHLADFKKNSQKNIDTVINNIKF